MATKLSYKEEGRTGVVVVEGGKGNLNLSSPRLGPFFFRSFLTRE